MSWLDELDVIVAHDDLLSVEVDAIVCPVTVKLEDYGKISRKIFEIATPSMQKDLMEVKKSLPNNQLRLGESISIDCAESYGINNCRKLIFTALWDFVSEYNMNLFYKAYINSFRRAFEDELKTIALPIMAYDGHINLCGKAAVKVIKELDCLKNSSRFSVEEVYFISTNENHIKYFEKEVEPYIYLRF